MLRGLNSCLNFKFHFFSDHPALILIPKSQGGGGGGGGNIRYANGKVPTLEIF